MTEWDIHRIASMLLCHRQGLSWNAQYCFLHNLGQYQFPLSNPLMHLHACQTNNHIDHPYIPPFMPAGHFSMLTKQHSTGKSRLQCGQDYYVTQVSLDTANACAISQHKCVTALCYRPEQHAQLTASSEYHHMCDVSALIWKTV